MHKLTQKIKASSHAGILYMIFSVLCFAIVNVIAKTLHHIPVHELIFFRAFVSFFISWWYIRKLKLSFWGNKKKWLFMRGLTGLGALLLFFSTIKHMPLATASTIQYLSTIFTVFLAVYINKQAVRPIQWFFFLLAMLGVVLIKGFDTQVETIWLLAGIASAVLAGLAYNSIIRAKAHDHPLTIVMYFPLVSIPLMGIWCLFHWVQPQGWDWLLLLIMGIFTQFAQYLMTLALHSDRASKVTPWNYSGAIFSLIFGWIFFDEIIQMVSFIGMIVIGVAVVLNARLKPLAE
jgi:drug/metabolite transporter (DMT)-like permease